MITKKEFMKDYKQMSSEEQKSYIERVDKWNEETFPQLMAQASSWMNVPVKEFNEGLKLVSAINRARPFVVAHRSYKSVEVVLNKMHALLNEVREKSGLKQLRTIPVNDMRKWFAATEVKSAPDENGVVTVKKYEEPEVDGRRPQHVSEYIHLLPKSLQMEAINLKQMHMELSMYRGEAEELSKDAHATKEQVAEKARKAVDTEQRIRLLYATIDAAYKKAMGQKLNEDEEALLAQEEEQPQMFKRAGEYTKEEIDAMPAGKMKEDCIAARKEADKKYVRREPKNITDDYKAQLELRVNELLAWGEEITEKMLQQLSNAGVVIEGVNDDLFGGEFNIEKDGTRVATKDELDGKTMTVVEGDSMGGALAGIEENPMDGIELHKAESEIENN